MSAVQNSGELPRVIRMQGVTCTNMHARLSTTIKSREARITTLTEGA